MRVQRSSVDDVRNALKRKRPGEEEPKEKPNPLAEYEEKMRLRAEEEEARKESKRQKRKEAKETKKAEKQAANAEVDDSLGGADPDMMAMMGFGGFGGSKKT